MKCFVIDFVSISFSRFKVHGGGDFALRSVEFLLERGIKFFIINNQTEYYPEYSFSNIEELKKQMGNLYSDVFYFNPLYQRGDNNDFTYKKKYFYIHGLRMLEMPYDETSHLYFTFFEGVKTRFKRIFLRKYYNRTGSQILESVERARGDKIILTPSEHSKYMMISSYRLRTDVQVLPPFLNTREDDSEVALPTDKKYILMLNGDRWVKNSYRFLSAFVQLKKQDMLAEIDLVMVGQPVFSDKFIHPSIKYLDYVERTFLEKLMKNCFFLAYPSLNEGFGYPPLDCFKYGRPVLSTALSSPNILYNGQVVFTNPYSVDEIKSRILYLIDNYDLYSGGRDYYEEMIAKIEEKWLQIF